MKCPDCGCESSTSISFTSINRGKRMILTITYCIKCRKTLDKSVREEQAN